MFLFVFVLLQGVSLYTSYVLWNTFSCVTFYKLFLITYQKEGKKKKKSLVATSQIKAFTLEKALDFQIKLTRSKGMEEDECERALKKD